MKIQYSSPGITIFESALYRTTSTILSLKNSILIVDPNWLPEEVTYIRSYVERFYKGYKTYLLFTHSDYDHIIGYGSFPGATVIATDCLKSNPEKEAVIKQIFEFDFTYYIDRPYPILYPEVHHAITSDQSVLKIDDTELYFYLSPGHNADAMFVIIPSLSCWIAGDYLSNIEIPLVDHNLLAYNTTLAKARHIIDYHPEITILITGHGDVALTREEIIRRIDNDEAYLHFLSRCSSATITPEADSIIRKYSSNPHMLTAHQNNYNKIFNTNK